MAKNARFMTNIGYADVLHTACRIESIGTVVPARQSLWRVRD